MNPQSKIDKISYGENELLIEWEIDEETKKQIIEFLKNKKEKAESYLAVISHNELDALKDAIKKAPDWLTEFLESQEKETISSSEIMKGSTLEKNIWWSKELKLYLDIWDESSYKYFFEWDDALFRWLNISEDTKRNFSVWANFFIINYLNEKLSNANLSWDISSLFSKLLWNENEKGLMETLPETLLNWESIYDNLSSNFDLFTDISFWDIGNTLNSFFGSEKIKLLEEVMSELEIQDNWENNWIFMNPFQSHEFMKYIFETDGIDKKDIINYINSNNWVNLDFSENDASQLKDIWDKLTSFITPEMWSVLWKWIEIQKLYENSKDQIKDAVIWSTQALSVISFLKDVPYISDLIKMFLDFLWITDIDTLLSWKNFESSKKSIEENIIKKWTVFEWKLIPENFMENPQGNNDELFLYNINNITWNKKWDDFWKSIEDLFKKDWELILFYNEVKIDFNLWDLYNWEYINYEVISDLINLYKEYINLKDKNQSITIKEFIRIKKSEIEKNKSTLEWLNSSLIWESDIELINDENVFEISDNLINYVFEYGWNKYKLNLSSNWELIITWWGKIVKFSWWNEIFELLKKYKWVLDKKATAKDFWKDKGLVNPELDWLTIKEILLKWIDSSFYWQGVKEEWLYKIITSNFINNKWLKKENLNINFDTLDINLKVEWYNWFINEDTQNQWEVDNWISQESLSWETFELTDKELKYNDWNTNYEVKFWWKEENALIVTINSKKYKLNQKNNPWDLFVDYPKFTIKKSDWEYILNYNEEQIKVEELISKLKDTERFVLISWLIFDLVLERV